MTTNVPIVTSFHFLICALGLLAGCGEKPQPAAKSLSPAQSSPALPAVSGGAVAPAAGPAVGQAKGGPPSPPPAFDFAVSKRELDQNGNPVSDLEMLNRLVMAYSGRSMSMAATPTGTFKTPEEQVAAMSAQYAKQGRPLKSLSDLVTAGMIKALPQAPAGKQYVLDAKIMQVVMTDKK